MIALLHEGHHAEALIIGERGRGGLTGLLLDPVSLAVAARAHGPAVVVPVRAYRLPGEPTCSAISSAIRSVSGSTMAATGADRPVPRLLLAPSMA